MDTNDRIAKNDRVSFVRAGRRVFGDVADIREGKYWVSAGYWGIVPVLPKEITKECG